MTIRKANKKDSNEVLKLMHKGIYAEYSSSVVRRMMKNSYPQGWFLACLNKMIVGGIAFSSYDSYYNASIFEVSFLAVNRQERSRGIGKALFNSALKSIREKLKEKGIKLVMLFVQTDGENKEAIGFYRSVFKRVGKVTETRIKDAWPKTWSGDKDVVFMFVRLKS